MEAVIHAAGMRAVKLGLVGIQAAFYVAGAVLKVIFSRR